ncbi:FAD-dependent thymidylate synthase [Candidatus Woesearchaeota archaeon]|nr:FAD-dependent thymidylate synthase [Candidatus Woesearchaeota archaeon]
MEKKLNVKLLKYTPIPANIVATAARLCYSKSEINDLLEKMTDDKCEELLKKLIDLGHESPLEHAYFTFGIEGISRACSHQLVRHRIASYSQQSQRYVDSKEFNYIIPPSIKKDEDLTKEYEEMMIKIGEIYEKLKEIAPKEDARFILPNACETKIIVTMNARSLKNFFHHRICKRAQWEIQAMAREMLKECKLVAPTLFANMGAPCTSEGICPEGEMNCGLWLNMPNAMIKYKGKIMNKEEYKNVKGN